MTSETNPKPWLFEKGDLLRYYHRTILKQEFIIILGRYEPWQGPEQCRWYHVWYLSDGNEAHDLSKHSQGFIEERYIQAEDWSSD